VCIVPSNLAIPLFRSMSFRLKATEVDHLVLEEKAGRYLSASPRPFLRWAGSKRSLLSRIVDVLPATYRRYHEPFLGSGSLFFLLQPEHAVLSDACGELVDTFMAVRDNPELVLRHIAHLKVARDVYYTVRANRSHGRYKRAAEFIYLNKACWNGLYRVNSRGDFNVPYGAPRSANVIDHINLRECAEALSAPGVHVRRASFRQSMSDVACGDLVFLDPPYVTGHNNNGFIDYNETLFSWADQVEAAKAAVAAANRGAHVIVTNAHHDDVLALYPGFSVKSLSRASTLASNSAKRRRVREAVIWRGAE
jgi:DNA adenine methylase